MNSGKNIIILILLFSLPLCETFCQTENAVDKNASSAEGTKRFLYAGFIGGVTLDNYMLNISNNEFESFSNPSPFGGISLKLLNPHRVLGFMFQTTIAPTAYHYSYLIKNSTSDNYFETTLKSLANTSRIGITVLRPKNKFLTPFAGAGALASIYLNQKYENYENQVITADNTIFSFYNHDKLNSSFCYGAFIQAGLIFNMNKGNIFILSGGYDYLISFGSERIQSCNLAINYILKFRK